MAQRQPAEVSRIRDWQDKYRVVNKRVAIDDRELTKCLTDLRLPGSSVGSATFDINNELRSLGELVQLQKKQRHEEADALKTTVNHVRGTIKDTIYLIRDIDSGKIDPVQLQSSLDSSNEILTETKKYIIKRYEELQSDYTALDRELESLARRFESGTWGVGRGGLGDSQKKLDGGAKGRRGKGKGMSQFSTLPPSIQNFEDFIAKTGGHTGGWDADDHLKFVKALQHIPEGQRFGHGYGVQDENEDEKEGEGVGEDEKPRLKISLREAILGKLAKGLPLYDLEDVLKHDKWYREYCALDEARRQAVAEWKKEKERERGGDGDGEVDGNRQKAEREKEKEKEKEKEREEKERREVAEAKRRDEERAKLMEWKSRQQLIRHKEEAEKKRKEEEKKKKELERNMRRKHALEAKLATWEAQKKADSDVRRREEEKEKERGDSEYDVHELDAITMVRLQRREQEALERRLELKKKAEMKLAARQIRQNRLADMSRPAELSNVSRDPSRLYQRTAASKHRQMETEMEMEADAEKGRGKIAGIMDVGHRAVPEWRKGL